MFGLSLTTEIFQGSATERTWNCVSHFLHLIWTKLNHIRQLRMPRSRKRHHSRSKSRSRSPSRDRSRDRDDKHKKIDSHERDRDGKRRKIESYDSPNHKRSVSSESNNPTPEEQPRNQEVNTDQISKVDKNIDELDNTVDNGLEAMELSVENESINESIEISKNESLSSKSNIVLDDSDDKIEPSTQGSTLANKSTLEATPKKGNASKKMQKKIEFEKKRQERQKEKEEKERIKNEERERIKQDKLKKKEEKQKELEQKQKEKELKEEQRKKEKEEKEEIKRKEREEKEQKRKEREEREEQKRKEKEQEKIKRQQEIEEKNKEKQREEEKKQKAAAAFVNFFVAKKTENSEERKMDVTKPSAFMAFEVKSDMKLPPTRRIPLSDEEKETLTNYIENQNDSASYLKDLKSGKPLGKSNKTWPFEETVDDEVTVIEEENNFGETVSEDKSKVQKLRAKFFKFHENRRPPYFGTWRKKSKFITSRKPFAEDKDTFNYEEESDDDWEEEEQGESLNGSDEEADKENDEKDDYEVDNEFFVPHGHLSDDEVDDEETARLSPESMKQKLKLLKDEFDQDMQSKTHKLKPRYIGCIWYNKNGTNVDEAINRYLQPLAIISNGQIQIKKRSEINTFSNIKKNAATSELNPEYVPMFLKIIHGNSNKKRVLVEQFMTYMANNGFTVDIKKTTLIKNLKNFASWRKCKENGPMKNKLCWLVNEDIEKKYNIDLDFPDILESDKK